MSDAGVPNDPDFEQESSKLSEGLKNCRAVVSGYRALLAPQQNMAALADKPLFSSFDTQEGPFGD